MPFCRLCGVETIQEEFCCLAHQEEYTRQFAPVTIVQKELFTVGEAIRFGWKKTTDNLLLLVGAGIITYAIAFIGNLQNLMPEEYQVLGALVGLTTWFLQIITGMGIIKISLKIHDGEKAAIKDLFNTVPLFFKSLANSIIVSILVCFGVVLLVVPGIILGIKFWFCGWFIVDKNSGPLEAMNKSWDLTADMKWLLCKLGLALIGINILGLLALVVGLLVTMPLTILAATYAYRNLLAVKADSNAMA